LQDLLNEKDACYCVLEPEQGDDWFVFYDGDERTPVMPVSQAPATFDGAARTNVSNAMHAISATLLLGVGASAVRQALSRFNPGQDLTPGRMNVFDVRGFRVIMDFAHNPDGMKKIAEFVDRQSVTGRKLLAFAGLGKRSDELNRKSAQAVAGHFDFYFCKDIEPSKPPRRRYCAPFMQQTLIEEGVPAANTTVVTFGREVIFSILDACEPGDLLVLLVGHSESRKVPVYIRDYTAKKKLEINE
jgi:cyanophycin synthetase